MVLRRHLDVAQGRVHRRGDRGDCAVNDGSIFELDRDRLVCDLHQKSVRWGEVSSGRPPQNVQRGAQVGNATSQLGGYGEAPRDDASVNERKFSRVST